MGSMQEISQRPLWTDSLHKYLTPYWDGLLSGHFVEAVTNTKLTVAEMQGWILQLYPFIHTFPKFLAEALTKVEDDFSRGFLIDNIRVEKAHAEHWIWMGEGFGITRREMLELAEGAKPILRDVQSLTDWLWHVNTKGSLAEAVAATSFAIEGITGDMARKAYKGFEAYRGMPGVNMVPKTYKWMREHCDYDDEHPKVALEIVKRYAVTEKMQTKVMLAAKRSLQLLHLAFDTASGAFSEKDTLQENIENDQRASDRRADGKSISFPERRFGERRGRVVKPVA